MKCSTWSLSYERERERERDEERESKREGAEKETERKKKKQKVREVDRQGNNYIQTCVCLNNPYAPDWALDSGLCTLHFIIIALLINPFASLVDSVD